MKEEEREVGETKRSHILSYIHHLDLNTHINVYKYDSETAGEKMNQHLGVKGD